MREFEHIDSRNPDRPRDRKLSATIERIELHLRAPEKPFRMLASDPFTLDRASWKSTSTPICHALTEMEGFEYMFAAQEEVKLALGDSIKGCARTLLPTVVVWLDFLLPKNGYVEIARKDMSIVIRQMVGILMCFMELRDDMQDLLTIEPHIFHIISMLWLCHEPYLRALPTVHLDEIHQCLQIAVNRAISTGDCPPSLGVPHLTRLAVQGALSSVKYRPRRLYRAALDNVAMLLLSRNGSYPCGRHVNHVGVLRGSVPPRAGPRSRRHLQAGGYRARNSVDGR